MTWKPSLALLLAEDMLVIPDTSVFEEDLLLRSVQWRLLLENAAAANLTIAVPQVVLAEVVNRFREKVYKHIGTVTESLAVLNRLTDSHLDNPIKAEDPEHWIRWYRDQLRARIKGRGGQILKMPRIPHAKLVRRDLNRRKPFAESGKGYRDALIWETILQAVREGHNSIAFVCKDTRDFAGPDKGHASFHPHLLGACPRKISEQIWRPLAGDRLKASIGRLAADSVWRDEILAPGACGGRPGPYWASIVVILSIADTIHLQNVMRQAHQRPFPLHLHQPPQ